MSKLLSGWPLFCRVWLQLQLNTPEKANQALSRLAKLNKNTNIKTEHNMLELTDQLDMYVHILDSMIERYVLEVLCTSLVADMDYTHVMYYCNNAFIH